eukprot:2234324-Prymnesium_polylepis.1
MPDIEPQSRSVTLSCRKMRSRCADFKQGRNRHVRESDGGMRPFLRVSISAFAEDRTALEGTDRSTVSACVTDRRQTSAPPTCYF